MKDYCTWFPESWRGIYIGDCCKGHDDTCSTHAFYKCLRKKIGLLGSLLIALGGSVGCWVKYTSRMWRRV